MGKRYIPVVIRTHEHRLYLADLNKIYKRVQRKAVPIPAFKECCLLRKTSLETCAEERH
jgi:hypothetical protein